MFFRLQSLYLFGAALCTAANFGLLPFWTFTIPVLNRAAEQLSLYGFQRFGMNAQGSASALFILFNALVVIAAALCLIGIFLYSNRNLQQQVIATATIASILTVLCAVAAALSLRGRVAGPETEVAQMPGAGLLFILVAILLQWLARRGVKGDDKIANAYKRL